jgi:hypothetical protein
MENKKKKKDDNGMYPSKLLQMKFLGPVQLGASRCEAFVPFAEWLKERDQKPVKKKKR